MPFGASQYPVLDVKRHPESKRINTPRRLVHRCIVRLRHTARLSLAYQYTFDDDNFAADFLVVKRRLRMRSTLISPSTSLSLKNKKETFGLLFLTAARLRTPTGRAR
jgi:hypothetical protein